MTALRNLYVALALFMLMPAAAWAQASITGVFFGGAGGRSNEGRIQVDGLTTTAALNGGGASSYVPDIGNAQEITLSSSGGLGEMQAGGPVISIIPKTGGNTACASMRSTRRNSGRSAA